MAGILVTLAVEGAPQSGTQSIQCSAPANLAAVEAALDTAKVFLQVTDATTGAQKYLGVSRIVEILGT